VRSQFIADQQGYSKIPGGFCMIYGTVTFALFRVW